MAFPIISPLTGLVPYVVKEVKENPVKTIVPCPYLLRIREVVEGGMRLNTVEECNIRPKNWRLKKQRLRLQFKVISNSKAYGKVSVNSFWCQFKQIFIQRKSYI